MGAFLLISEKKRDFNIAESLSVIEQQCGTSPVFYQIAGFQLYSFPKKHSCCNNIITDGDKSLFAFGSPFIRNMTYDETLRKVLETQTGTKREVPDISGLFFILINNNSELSFITDETGLYSIYHSDDGLVMSSSFLALCNGAASLSLNRGAVVENLLTGSIHGEETIFNGILRFNPKKRVAFSDIKFSGVYPDRREIPQYESSEEALDAQVDALANYFGGIRRSIGTKRIDAGITGGFDSRLLLAELLKWYDSDKISLHNFKRIKADSDYNIGKEIAEAFHIDFRTVEPVEEDKEGSDLEAFEKGMIYADGQIRTHLFWHERFNTFEYRLLLLDGIGIGMSGIGGEQYRNQERLVSKGINLRKWIEYYLVKRLSGNNAVSSREFDHLISVLENKITSGLEIDPGQPVNLLHLKRYMNELYNPANRGLRASFENRLMPYFLPFADPEVALAAYGSAEHLGGSLNFQAKLIKKINPDLAKIRSGYGYDFYSGEPLAKYLPQVVIENFIPSGLRSSLTGLVLKRETQRWYNMTNRSLEILNLVRELDRYDLKIDTGALLSRTDLGPLVLALGYILSVFRDKIIR